MKFIRNALVPLAIVVSTGPAVANDQDLFYGDWRGTMVMTEDGTEESIRILVEENDADNYYCINGKWKAFEKIQVSQFKRLENNALLIWIDKGERWTETQTFSLSYVNKDTMALAWIRHVNIANEADHETWHSFGHGTLKKASVNSSDACD